MSHLLVEQCADSFIDNHCLTASSSLLLLYVHTYPCILIVVHIFLNSEIIPDWINLLSYCDWRWILLNYPPNSSIYRPFFNLIMIVVVFLQALAGHCTEISVTLHVNGTIEVQDNGRGERDSFDVNKRVFFCFFRGLQYCFMFEFLLGVIKLKTF